MAENEDDIPAVLNNTVTINHDKQKFVFHVPSFTENIQLGMSARAIRRRYDPNGSGDLQGLDMATAQLTYACACFELLLDKADATDNWPFVKDDKGLPVLNAAGKPLIDHSKFPEDQLDTVAEVGQRLEIAILRFRQERIANRNSTGG